MIKLIAHSTTMMIPIANTLYENNYKIKKRDDINFKKLNNLNFDKVSLKKFPLTNIISKIPNKDSLFETILVSVNDELVDLFLKKKKIVFVFLFFLIQVKHCLGLHLTILKEKKFLYQNQI